LTPIRLCLEPRCPNPATGRGRCDLHRKALERERSRARREATKGVYKKKIWEMRRKQAIERDPFCAWTLRDGSRCPSLGEQLDHKVPLSEGGPAYDQWNLQLLCAEHHRLKTAIENSRRGGRVPDAVA
jgi:5-methylcytosine-specific restriction endonuclease McrA